MNPKVWIFVVIIGSVAVPYLVLVVSWLRYQRQLDREWRKFFGARHG